MTQDDVQRIEACQKELREQLLRLDAPVMVLEGDEEFCEIVGNEAAFLRLAIDSLDVARKRNQGFVVPLSGRGIPVQIAAMRFDPEPELTLEVKQSWPLRTVGSLLIFAIVVIFAIGVIVTWSWIMHQVAGWFRH